METEEKYTEQAEEQETSTKVRSTVLEHVLLATSTIVNVFSWVLVFWKIPYTPDTVILHYNIYFGIDLSGPWWRVCVLPAFGVAAILIHRFLLRPYDSVHASMRSVSFAVLTLVQLLILLAILLIIPLNN